MRRILLRSLSYTLLALLIGSAYVGWRAFGVFQTAYGGFQHLRYLLESGETVEGAPADDVLSDSYLLTLFGDNPELVDRLKSVVDLGMAADANLKLGSVSAMIVTHSKAEDGSIVDAAIYAVGGFPEPKSKRLGFHASGYFRQELDESLWMTGNALVNLMGRDIIVFCEQDKAEQHMSLLFDILQGGVLSLAQRIVQSTVYYAVVFPEPKELAPPNLRNLVQTIMIKGEMGGDFGYTETIFIAPNYRSAAQAFVIFKDMLTLARITFHDQFSGYVKDMGWGEMNDSWWATEYVDMIDTVSIIQDGSIVVARTEYDRVKNNAILKTIERAGRDIAMKKSFALAGELPWEFAFKEMNNPSGGYWSQAHRWGSDWPLGDGGIPTAGSIAAAVERERIRLDREAENLLRQQSQNLPDAVKDQLPAQSL
jgi:hypothetical protein